MLYYKKKIRCQQKEKENPQKIKKKSIKQFKISHVGEDKMMLERGDQKHEVSGGFFFDAKRELL